MTDPGGGPGPGLRSSARVDGGLRLVLDNSLDAIEAARVEIRAFLGSRGGEGKAVGRLEVILEELLANIVRHGFQPGADHAIELAVSLEPQAIRVTVEDDGAPFDPLQVPPPPPFESLDDARLGGLGVHLVRKLSQSVTYTPLPGRSREGRAFAPRNRTTVSVARG